MTWRISVEALEPYYVIVCEYLIRFFEMLLFVLTVYGVFSLFPFYSIFITDILKGNLHKIWHYFFVDILSDVFNMEQVEYFMLICF